MTLTIELTPDQEARLKRNATAQGKPEEEIVRELIEQLPAEPKKMTGREALAYWEQNGLLGAFKDRKEDSPELARELRRQAEDRQWDKA